MDIIELFNDLSEESSKLMKQFIELNPIGSIILNEHFEIVNINERVKNYFEGDINLAENFFGNIFNCHTVYGNQGICGTKHQCSNCKIRNSLLNALEQNQIIKNLHVNKIFVGKGIQQIKWFDMTIVPIEIRMQKYLWLSLIDLTELMRYKLEFEMNTILSDEDNAVDKDYFHEDVMNCIRTNCYTGGEAYLVLIELKHTESVQENFGALWRNDYLSSFHHYLKDNLDVADFVCRYSQNQFMTFLPCKDEVQFQMFLKKLKNYEYSHFNTNDGVVTRGIKFKMNSENIKEIVGKDGLYIEYFKAISLLEQLDEEDIFELIF